MTEGQSPELAQSVYSQNNVSGLAFLCSTQPLFQAFTLLGQVCSKLLEHQSGSPHLVQKSSKHLLLQFCLLLVVLAACLER